MLHRSKNSIDASRNKALLAEILGISNPTFPRFMFLVLFLITMGWMGDTLLEFVKWCVGNGGFPGWPAMGVGMLPFMVVSAWGWVRWHYARRERLSMRAISSDVDPHKGVILFLSNIGNPDHLEKLKANDRSVFEEPKFSWMQTVRGLNPHKEKLEKVWVMCSPQSTQQFDLFHQMFTSLYPDVDFIRCGGDKGVEFEDMEGLVQILEDIFADLPADMDESDVIVDITSGQKPNSVAGMLVTMVGNGREVQYVQTGKSHKVKTYAYEISLIGRKVGKRK